MKRILEYSCQIFLLTAFIALNACATVSQNAASSAKSPGRIQVDAHQGLPPLLRWPAVPPTRIDILVDITPSMLAETGAGRTRMEASRFSAAQFVRSLPSGTELAVHTLGNGRGIGCIAPARMNNPLRGWNPLEVANELNSLTARVEGSLPDALSQLYNELSAAGDLHRTRVVVFSDLGEECGGTLCTQASALATAGTRIDFVTFGNAPLPSCLEALAPAPEAPRALSSKNIVSKPLRYEVLGVSDRIAALTAKKDAPVDVKPVVLVSGVSGEQTVTVPARMITVVIDLEPPERIGPFMAAPGKLTRIRLIDFPGVGPPVRAWKVETQP